MGWSESRVSMFPPRWRPRTEIAQRRQANGNPLYILRCERDEAIVADVIEAESVAGWLRERGFELRRRSAKSATLGRDDIEVDLFTEEAELSQVELTFSLSKESPGRWETWKTFVDEFCDAWKLELAADHDRKVKASELIRLLATHPSWQDFQQAYAWPSAVQTGP